MGQVRVRVTLPEIGGEYDTIRSGNDVACG